MNWKSPQAGREAAVRRLSVLMQAVLLAAATAAADTVITVEEVIPCSVESADTDSVRLRMTGPRRRLRTTREAYEMTRQRRRALSTRDIYEIRLSNSSRVAELAVRLPGLQVTLDSGKTIAPPESRTREVLRRDLNRAGEARVEGLFWSVDTLPRNASPAEMAARCRDMAVRLRWCGRSDDAMVELLFEVSREEAALRRIWHLPATGLVSGPIGGLLGGSIGGAVGSTWDNAVNNGCGTDLAGSLPGALLGCVAGSAAGMVVGGVWRETVLKKHRNRVNDLLRKVNLAVVTAP